MKTAAGQAPRLTTIFSADRIQQSSCKSQLFQLGDTQDKHRHNEPPLLRLLMDFHCLRSTSLAGCEDSEDIVQLPFPFGKHQSHCQSVCMLRIGQAYNTQSNWSRRIWCQQQLSHGTYG